MTPYIKNVNANLFGLFAFNATFHGRSLNFISGENGTGKSRLLEFIKNNIGNPNLVIPNSGQLSSERIAFYNPKRNSQKKDIAGVLDQIRRDGKKTENFLAQLAQNYNEGYAEYPNFPDIFVSAVDEIITGNNRTPSFAVSKVKREFEQVISRVLPYITIDASWDIVSRQPQLFIKKYARSISSNQLSVGENEIISLATSIYSSRKMFDIYLIDEPEIHLNWLLEKNLFDYLDWFAESQDKQIITVTHSPVVFESKYENKTNFLSWIDGNIVVQDRATGEISNRLASRVVNTIQTFNKEFDYTFVVEDQAHKLVVENLGIHLSKKILIIIAESREKVISMHKAIGASLQNSFFMVDGDNDDYNNSKLVGNIFALKKYSIENYLLDTKILSQISKNTNYKSEIKIKKLIIEKIKNSRNPEFNKRFIAYIKLAECSQRNFFEVLHTLDGSFLLKDTGLINELGFNNNEDFIHEYLLKAKDINKLKTDFEEIVTKLS